MEIKIGQIWQRKDGRMVEITDKRFNFGSLDFHLTPLEKGRTSWKWHIAIQAELTFVREGEKK